MVTIGDHRSLLRAAAGPQVGGPQGPHGHVAADPECPLRFAPICQHHQHPHTAGETSTRP